MSLRALDASTAREFLGERWPAPVHPREPFARATQLHLEDGDSEVEHLGLPMPDREIGHINDDGDFILERTLSLDEYATALSLWESSPYRLPGRVSVRSGPCVVLATFETTHGALFEGVLDVDNSKWHWLAYDLSLRRGYARDPETTRALARALLECRRTA